MATAEILSIGTELLLGQILDTNSRFLSEELASMGIDCLYHGTVGDNKGRIIGSFKHALRRSCVVISTGGLGPTADDLTHESLAELFGIEMIYDESVFMHIQALFSSSGIKMAGSNKKQAYRPAGSQILANPTGTAPGIIWKLDGSNLQSLDITDKLPRYILTFPGVPSEMMRMWRDYARPYLQNELGGSIIWSQDLKHYGIGESRLAEKYADLLAGNNPTVAPLAGAGECRLRVSVKAKSEAEARMIAAPVIEKIKAESGTLCYGTDDDTLESVLAGLLIEKGFTIAAAESCTGGLLSKRLTDIAGSSAYVKLNLVTYANEAKEEMLSVSAATLADYGAVSKETALEMAAGVRKLARSTFGLSITGIAGPGGGQPDKPVGLVYFGLSCPEDSYVMKKEFPQQLGRDGIRMRSSSESLNFIRLYLLEPDLLSKYRV